MSEMAWTKVKSVAKQVSLPGPRLNRRVVETMKTISDVVGATLGPGGRPVLIERQEYGMPGLVTKDGVTVFRSLGFSDPVAHSIMECTRDAATRTVTEAGDGPQPLWSQILTPTGFVRMGDIQVGMEVCGTNQSIQRVLGVFDKGQREIVEIIFEGGFKVECCLDHLWTVRTKNGLKTISVRQMIQDLKLFGSYYSIPKTKIGFNNKSELPLDPYFVGVLIGAGNTTDGEVTISLDISKKYVLKKLVLPKGVSLEIIEADDLLKVKIQGITAENTESLIGPVGTDYRFIPKSYLLSDVGNRTKLLRGIINTSDARCLAKTPQLALDFNFLVRSLAGGSNQIIGIKRTGRVTEMRCIKVSNPDNLYITDNFVVTHNTTSATVLAYSLVKYAQKFLDTHPRVSPQRLVQDIQNAFDVTLEPLIRKLSIKVDFDTENGQKILHDVAQVSANGDVKLADAVMEAFNLVGDSGTVTIIESSGPSAYKVERIHGFPIPMGYEESCQKFMTAFINDGASNRCYLRNPQFVLFNGTCSDVQSLIGLLEKLQGMWLNRPGVPNHMPDQPYITSPNVVIVSNGFSESVLGTLALNMPEAGTVNVVPLVIPKTAIINGEVHFLEDLSAITGATVLNPLSRPLDSFIPSDLGRVEITTDEGTSPGEFEMFRFRSTIIGRNDEDEVGERAEAVQAMVDSAPSEYDRRLMLERLACLTGGIAKLTVIGSTNGEMRERKDRADDAVQSVKGAIKHGALPAGGWTLMKCANHLLNIDNRATVREVLVPALQEPVRKLFENTGSADVNLKWYQRGVLGRIFGVKYDKESITGRVEEYFRMVRNDSDSPLCAEIFSLPDYKKVNAVDEGLLDSVPAVLEALRNAVSIASLVGTLGAVVVFERDREHERAEAEANEDFIRNANVNQANQRW